MATSVLSPKGKRPPLGPHSHTHSLTQNQNSTHIETSHGKSFNGVIVSSSNSPSRKPLSVDASSPTSSPKHSTILSPHKNGIINQSNSLSSSIPVPILSPGSLARSTSTPTSSNSTHSSLSSSSTSVYSIPNSSINNSATTSPSISPPSSYPPSPIASASPTARRFKSMTGNNTPKAMSLPSPAITSNNNHYNSSLMNGSTNYSMNGNNNNNNNEGDNNNKSIVMLSPPKSPHLFSPTFHTHNATKNELERDEATAKVLVQKRQEIKEKTKNPSATNISTSSTQTLSTVIDKKVLTSDDMDLSDNTSVVLDCSNDTSSTHALALALSSSSSTLVSYSAPSTPTPSSATTLDEDDFDPFLFIKHLPPLPYHYSQRQSILPSRLSHSPQVTLALDLDETLVHCSITPLINPTLTFNVTFNGQDYNVYVKVRPYLKEFLKAVREMFEVVVFTASQRVYADALLNILDPGRELILHRVFRDSCVCIEGNYLKDLTILGRDLSSVAIIDNSVQAFAFQLDNGIPIESWYDDTNDKELLYLLPFLTKLREKWYETKDLRPFLRDFFNLKSFVQSL